MTPLAERIEKMAEEFCKDWPVEVYHPNDLSVFYVRGAQAVLALLADEDGRCEDHVWLGFSENRPTGSLYEYDPSGMREDGTIEFCPVSELSAAKARCAELENNGKLLCSQNGNLLMQIIENRSSYDATVAAEREARLAAEAALEKIVKHHEVWGGATCVKVIAREALASLQGKGEEG
jgi:hypothetical protein